MAVFHRIDENLPINNGGAVVFVIQDKSDQDVQLVGSYQSLHPSGNFHTLLDGRFKVGGSTSWERPGSDL